MLTMEGGPTPKKARVKQEFETRVITSLPDAVQIHFEEEHETDHSPGTECGDSSSDQYEPIEVPIEYSEETFPVNFIEDKLKTEALKNSNTQFILCQPNESLETVKYSWTHSMTYILIEEYRKLMSDFQDPHKKQKDSWVKLAENMCRRGCDVTWVMCDQKWRNLKHTFKSIYYNKHRSEKSKRRWDFYQVLEDVFKPQLEAEDLKKTTVVSPRFPTDDIASKSESVSGKDHKVSVDAVSYQLPVDYHSSNTYDVYEAEPQNEGSQPEDRNNVKDSLPPIWFQEFLKEYRETEDQRLALVREMHNDLLQIERRKVAALEGLLMKFFE
ncbi:Uncharacterized protein GBIM_11390 [Gryllus bimaculatus]|nr:Uncharacterized protein GBIM_11390 [Gryllus bimaculatus]